MIMTRLFPLLFLLLLVTGCSSMKPQDYAHTSPVLDLFSFFEGNTRAWGAFESRTGEIKRQFTVDIQGTIDGDTLTLVEDFDYKDGEKSQRTWVITKINAHQYRGEAADVVGKAKGVAYGQALNWRYRLRMPYKGREIELEFDDWMLLQAHDVLINRATVTKFGFRVGEVNLFFQKIS